MKIGEFFKPNPDSMVGRVDFVELGKVVGTAAASAVVYFGAIFLTSVEEHLPTMFPPGSVVGAAVSALLVSVVSYMHRYYDGIPPVPDYVAGTGVVDATPAKPIDKAQGTGAAPQGWMPPRPTDLPPPPLDLPPPREGGGLPG